jgi:hypothetical protein
LFPGKVKVTVSCPKNYAVKAYEGVELHVFLTSALEMSGQFHAPAALPMLRRASICPKAKVHTLTNEYCAFWDGTERKMLHKNKL